MYDTHDRSATCAIEALEPRMLLSGDGLAQLAVTQDASDLAGDPPPRIVSLELDSPAIDEGQSVTLHGTFADPDAGDPHTVQIDWGDGSSGTLDLAAGVLEFTVAHLYVDDDPTGTPSDLVPISVTVSDATGDDTAATAVTVNNAAPWIADFWMNSPDYGQATEKHEIFVTGIITDAGSADTHTASIDWGDGSAPEQLTVPEGVYKKYVHASHVYAEGGVYKMTLSVTDDDGGSDADPETMYITGAGITDGVLNIVGTAGKDKVALKSQRGNLVVSAGFLEGARSRTFDPADITTIKIWTYDGNDTIDVNRNVHLQVRADAGDGNDKIMGGGARSLLVGGNGDDRISAGDYDSILMGGAGRDVLVGGAGNDVLDGGDDADKIYGCDGDDTIVGGAGNDWIDGGMGNDVIDGQAGNDLIWGESLLARVLSFFGLATPGGRDVLVGGTGRDLLDGGADDDLLVGGYVDDVVNMNAVMDAWESVQVYESRVADIRASYLQVNVTAHDDDVVDVLTGGGGRDWYFADADGTDGDDDVITDQAPGEIVEVF